MYTAVLLSLSKPLADSNVSAPSAPIVPKVRRPRRAVCEPTSTLASKPGNWSALLVMTLTTAKNAFVP